MKKSHPVSEEADDPGDQVEETPKDTGEVDDTTQQKQVTGDPDELPDLVLDEPRIQPPQPPSTAAGAPTPGTPEEEKEKKGDDPDYRPSKKQLKKADKRGDK